MMDCGLLNKQDAREFYHWWTSRGHLVTLEKQRRLFRVYLTLNRRKP